VASTILLGTVLLIVNAIMIDNDEVMVQQTFEQLNDYAEDVTDEMHNEIDSINQVSTWKGWENVNPLWIVSVYSGDGDLIYSKGDRDIRFGSVVSVSKDLGDFEGAYIVVKSSTGEQGKIFQAVSMFFSLGFFVLLFTWQFRKIEKYTHEIADGIGILAGGELDYRIPVRGKNELTMLAGHINEMAHSLRRQSEEKQKSDTARDDLITNLAHDIRTPITVLEGYLSMMIAEQDMTEEKRHEYLQISLNKCRELTDRATNIFAFVHLSNDGEQMKSETVNARLFVAQRFEEMVMVLTAESFLCETDIKISSNQTFDVDTSKVQRVFDNLLSNILKYASKADSVIFRASVHISHIEVSIKNTMREPIDIPHERLFDRMVSGDRSRKNKSAGFGLSICKVIMNMHGGDITASVSDDTITFTLHFVKND
jgi:signal transduction histidine kinase